MILINSYFHHCPGKPFAQYFASNTVIHLDESKAVIAHYRKGLPSHSTSG